MKEKVLIQPPSTREELRQNRDFESTGHEAVVGLLLTADRMKARLSALAGEHDITVQQYNILRILNGAGSQGLPTLEIHSRLIERNAGITRLLDRLEAKKLIVRERLSADRRRHMCRITETGEALLERMHGPMKELTRSVTGHFSEEELSSLISMMDRWRTGM